MDNKQPTFTEREASAGLYGTTVSRDDFYTKRDRQGSMWSSFDSSEMLAGSPMDFKADGEGGTTYGQLLSGIISIADPSTGATTAEYISALRAVYSSQDPSYADIVTLLTGTGAFDARFIIFPDGDGAPSNATVAFAVSGTTWYAYNFSAISLSSMADALDQTFGLFDTSGTIPRDDDIDDELSGDIDADFQISISNLYSVSAEGVLSIGGTSPNVVVKGGDIEPMEGLTASIPLASNSTLVPAEGRTDFLHVYVKYEINFTGSAGSRVASSMGTSSIVFFDSTSEDYKEGGSFSGTQTKYTHFTYIGNVRVTRRGNRRFAKITQVRSGAINGIQNFNTTQAGTSTNSDGNDVGDKTKSGLREVTLCLNGKPYSTYIITSALFEIT